MGKFYIGVDNGVTGSIGIIDSEDIYSAEFEKIPIKTEQSYTKKKQNISRINWVELFAFFSNYKTPKNNSICLIERPMVNPGRFKATMSALRCLETVLICIEMASLPYQYIDSKQWQKELLPKGIKGSAELKKASCDIGIRLFPQYKEQILKHKDADGLLIAEWAKRQNL